MEIGYFLVQYRSSVVVLFLCCCFFNTFRPFLGGGGVEGVCKDGFGGVGKG